MAKILDLVDERAIVRRPYCHQRAGAAPQALRPASPCLLRNLHLADARSQAERTGHTLQPTAVVHEAFVRLAARDVSAWSDRRHFYAAAAQAMKLMAQGEVMMDAAYAVIDEAFCSGCKMCNDMCPYTAITFDDAKKVSVVNSALCKGCGTCVAACPAGAIMARHFTDEQIYAQIEGMLS